MLYVVATPLGNSQDITLRALELLREADEWVVEDTRRTAKLREMFNLPHKPLISYYDEVEEFKTEQLIEKLKQGLTLALVSDSGTPVVSDPGYNLIKTAHEEGIKVLPVPGPTAPVAALSVSGFPSDKFIFCGFLPKKKKARRDSLLEIKYFSGTAIFFESPRRIIDSLKLLLNLLGNRMVFVCAEMTKRFERYYRGPAREVIEQLSDDKIKGEFTVLVHPAEIESIEPEKYLRELLERGLKLSDAARIAGKFSDRSRSELYKLGLEIQSQSGLEEE